MEQPNEHLVRLARGLWLGSLSASPDTFCKDENSTLTVLGLVLGKRTD